jgi:hypothetical protein
MCLNKSDSSANHDVANTVPKRFSPLVIIGFDVLASPCPDIHLMYMNYFCLVPEFVAQVEEDEDWE